jgi:hypothetical protein
MNKFKETIIMPQKYLIMAFIILLNAPVISLANGNDRCVTLDHYEYAAKAINKHADEIRGSLYCESIELIESKLNRDDSSDQIILYSVEGACHNQKDASPGQCGNGFEQFISVFQQKNGKYMKPVTVEVGSRGKRVVSDFTVKGNKIILNTLSYRSNDGMCCPSKKGILVLKYDNGKIIKVK